MHYKGCQYSQKSNSPLLSLLSTHWPGRIQQAIILPIEICIGLIQKLTNTYFAIFYKIILNTIHTLAETYHTTGIHTRISNTKR